MGDSNRRHRAFEGEEVDIRRIKCPNKFWGCLPYGICREIRLENSLFPRFWICGRMKVTKWKMSFCKSETRNRSSVLLPIMSAASDLVNSTDVLKQIESCHP